MKRLFSKIALTLALLTLFALLSGGTASAHHMITTPPPQAIAAITSPNVGCPPSIPPGNANTIALLQRTLNELHRDFDDPRFWENSPANANPPLVVNGMLDPQTEAAIFDYQSWNGLSADGVVGPQTWHSLGFC